MFSCFRLASIRGLARPRLALVATLVATVLVPKAVFAFDFTPEYSEWAMWPEFCKARFATFELAKRTTYAGNVPQATIDAWRNRLGPRQWDPIHHYCASLIYLNRYYVARTDQDRRHLLYAAQDECAFTLRSLSQYAPTGPLYRPVAAHMRLIQSLQATLPPAPR